MSEFCTVYVTATNRGDAEILAARLVEEKLVACANIIDGVTSVYRWKGRVTMNPEVVIIAKTRDAIKERVIARIKALHEYECPCIVVWPIDTGNPDYLDWVASETGSSRQ